MLETSITIPRRQPDELPIVSGCLNIEIFKQWASLFDEHHPAVARRAVVGYPNQQSDHWFTIYSLAAVSGA
jgi:hypothetical protein